MTSKVKDFQNECKEKNLYDMITIKYIFCFQDLRMRRFLQKYVR